VAGTAMEARRPWPQAAYREAQAVLAVSRTGWMGEATQNEVAGGKARLAKGSSAALALGPATFQSVDAREGACGHKCM
jgi:hypothetical protein